MLKNITDKTALLCLFNRYSGNASTKDIAHLRLSKEKLGRPVLFTENTVFNMIKDEFLLNFKNKQCFLEMLTAEMNTVGTCATQSGRDAGTLIAITAVGIANLKLTVVFGRIQICLFCLFIL